MADLSKYTKPETYILSPLELVYPNALQAINEHIARTTAEAVQAIIEDMHEYRASIEQAGTGRYLRMKEPTPSILDGEGEWNLPSSDDNHVGEDL